jgi:hypothetical protein
METYEAPFTHRGRPELPARLSDIGCRARSSELRREQPKAGAEGSTADCGHEDSDEQRPREEHDDTPPTCRAAPMAASVPVTDGQSREMSR